MELRKLDFEKIFARCKEEGKDFIPPNWYISARKAWEIFAWAIVQIRNGTTIRTDKEVDKLIHHYWEYIEDRVVALGEEYEEDETAKS